MKYDIHLNKFYCAIKKFIGHNSRKLIAVFMASIYKLVNLT